MELSEYLNNLKLNSYEKEIITYLSSVNSADAKTIYKNTQVPKGRIYSVLNDLIEQGFVTVLPANPKRYTIEDIKKALDNFLEREKESIDEKRKSLTNLSVKPKVFLRQETEPSVRFYTGRQEFIVAVANLREETQQELIQLAPRFEGGFISALSVRKALERGVKMRLIVRAITEKNKKQLKNCLEYGGEVRTLNIKLLSLVMGDGKDFLLKIQDFTKDEEKLGILSRHQILCGILKDHFENLWKKAKPIKTIP